MDSHNSFLLPSDQFPQLSGCCCCCSVTQLCLTLCDPMDCSLPGFPAFHYSPSICSNSCPLSRWCHQPSHPLSPASPPTLNLSQHQGIFPMFQLKPKGITFLLFWATGICYSSPRKLLQTPKWRIKCSTRHETIQLSYIQPDVNRYANLQNRATPLTFFIFKYIAFFLMLLTCNMFIVAIFYFNFSFDCVRSYLWHGGSSCVTQDLS